MVEQHDSRGLLVCGHSLGGSMASLLAVEMYTEFLGSFPIHLVTFGGVRVFERSVAASLPVKDAKLLQFRHLRFVNQGDIIPAMLKDFLYHTGNKQTYNIILYICIYIY